MTSSENLDPWMFRPTFADSWISEAFARDTETLTKALQKSLSNHSETIMSSDAISPFFNLVKTETPTAQTPSFSSSDPDTAAPKRRNPIPITNSIGKTTKRKSRASKRTTTTFITADPANFRQMVQQVTGVRFGSGAAGFLANARHVSLLAGPQPAGGGSLLGGGASVIPHYSGGGGG
uniref:VQ domain-containing protein n=1 Tax=Davidia involucrata TaxID=16924 RepID=A0A5B6ZWS3_DAVIN